MPTVRRKRRQDQSREAAIRHAIPPDDGIVTTAAAVAMIQALPTPATVTTRENEVVVRRYAGRQA